MKYNYYSFEENQEKKYRKRKRIRHARNQPGKGMKIINYYQDNDDYEHFEEEDFPELAKK